MYSLPLSVVIILASCSIEGRQENDVTGKGHFSSIAVPTPNECYYTVIDGDDIWKISKKFNVTIKWLIKRNEIPDYEKIKPGYIMVVPWTSSNK